MNKIYFESNTFWLLRDYPWKPMVKDWIADAPHENGNYYNVCTFCREAFKGFKQRRVCALCEYDKAVKACIAAKTRIDNQVYWKDSNLYCVLDGKHNFSNYHGYGLLDSTGNEYFTYSKLVPILKDGSIFDLPANVEFEEKEEPYDIGPEGNKVAGEKFIHLKLKEYDTLKQTDSKFAEAAKKTIHNAPSKAYRVVEINGESQYELREMIAKVHDDIEGRYELDSYDKVTIHALLCKLQ